MLEPLFNKVTDLKAIKLVDQGSKGRIHKYFGDIKAEKIKEQKMRQIFEKKYLRRPALFYSRN